MSLETLLPLFLKTSLPETLEPNLANLRLIQKQFVTTFPYENLSVHYPKSSNKTIPASPYSLDPEFVINKLCGTRGGFCLEINTALYLALKHYGYKVKQYPATVIFNLPEGVDKVKTHMLLIVTLDQPYLCDTGAAHYSAFKPMPLIHGATEYGSGGKRLRLDVKSWRGIPGWTLMYWDKSKDVEEKYDPFFFFSDEDLTREFNILDSSCETFDRMLKHVTIPTNCQPPEFTELCLIMTEGCGLKMALGKEASGYTYTEKDVDGVLVDHVKFGDVETFRKVLRDKFGVVGF